MQAGEEQVSPVYRRFYPFRFVQPYPHVYRTYAKGRWIGKELLATLVKEFKAYPPEYYEQCVLNGMIMVNNAKVACDYVIKNGDQILHTSIRTEPPCLDLPVEIVQETEDYVVICKPPSLIVHTGGGHHFNTVEGLLKYEMGYENLHVLHRLDKQTSGLLVFARSKEKVALFHEESGNESMKKMYFARVAGEVKWQEKTLSAYIQCISHKDGVYKVIGEIEEKEKKQEEKENEQKEGKKVAGINEEKQKEEPQQVEPAEKVQISAKQFKQQQSAVHRQKKKKQKQQKLKQAKPDIKDSKTYFKKLWYDPETDSSLLQCYPVTGRTHQIRVHLQYLGHPILNDTCYDGKFVGNGIIKFIQNRTSIGEEEKLGEPMKKLKPSEELNAEDWDYHTKPWEIMLHSYRYTFGGNVFTSKPPYWIEKGAMITVYS